ncbi:nuclear transport factor 2 family protein [Streptomyces sp. bgisy100]|uniref:nuclear transport factor 2 family protein n=1 Tax=Streptomyces sp. bgisy100 TaxID=3413783 RepID=UPI003D76107D
MPAAGIVHATAENFRTAVEKRDLAAIERLFAPDIRFHSPVKFTPFEGRPTVHGLFGVLLRTFENFRYVGEFSGTAQLSDRAQLGGTDRSSGADRSSGTDRSSAADRFPGEAGAASAAGPVDGGAEADSHVLIFRATVNGKEIHGMDLLQLDEAGLIEEFTVMVRPQSALSALSEAVYAGLVADGLVPGS